MDHEYYDRMELIVTLRALYKELRPRPLVHMTKAELMRTIVALRKVKEIMPTIEVNVVKGGRHKRVIPSETAMVDGVEVKVPLLPCSKLELSRQVAVPEDT